MKRSSKTKTGNRRGANGPPKKRGRRGHSIVDQQAGFADWLEKQLLEDPRPTYDDIADRLKATGFYGSRSALARWGVKFEARRAAMKLLIEKARVLAQEDPETILTLEKATSNLAETKLFEFMLESADAKLTEDVLGAIFAHARLQSSSASRERAATVASGKLRTAKRLMQRAFEERLRKKPALLKEVLAEIETAFKEVGQ